MKKNPGRESSKPKKAPLSQQAHPLISNITATKY